MKKLPEDVPGDTYLNKMIDAELCMICNRSTKKGTDEYEYIKGLLNKHTSPLSDPETEKMNDYMKALKSYPQSLGYKIDQIEKEIGDYKNIDDELTKNKIYLIEEKRETKRLKILVKKGIK